MILFSLSIVVLLLFFFLFFIHSFICSLTQSLLVQLRVQQLKYDSWLELDLNVSSSARYICIYQEEPASLSSADKTVHWACCSDLHEKTNTRARWRMRTRRERQLFPAASCHNREAAAGKIRRSVWLMLQFLIAKPKSLTLFNNNNYYYYDN